MAHSSVIGAVLSGGQSKRMGQDKADVLVGERTMLERVGDALRRVSRHVVLLGPEKNGWECWPDSVHAQGPLAGIATALSRADEDLVLALAVDHPFARVETLRRLVEATGRIPVVPVDAHGVRQVTCAVYPKDIVEFAVAEAAAGGSIQSLLDQVSFDAVAPDTWEEWGEDGRSWFSVDSPEALEEGLSRFQLIDED